MAVSDTTHAGGSETSEPRRRLPYQALYAIAAVFVAISVVLIVFAVRDTSAGPSTIPPVTTPSAGTTSDPSVTPSPTPTSPEDKAAADATAAFVEYASVRNQLGRDGGSKSTEAKIVRLTTAKGAERAYIKGYAKRLRDRELRLTAGSSVVTSRVNAIELGEKPPRVDLTVCLDQRTVKATEKGKPAKVPDWLRYGVVMKLEAGKWLVDQVQNSTADLDPQEMNSCEP